MMPTTETSGDDAAEEWSTPVNWEEDPVIKAIFNIEEVPVYKVKIKQISCSKALKAYSKYKEQKMCKSNFCK